MRTVLVNISVFVGVFYICCLFVHCDRDIYRDLCGKRLADTISRLCGGNYAAIKRSRNLPSGRDLDYTDDSQQPQQIQQQQQKELALFNDYYYGMPFPFAMKSGQSQFLKSRSKKSGVVDECCSGKSCSVDELLGYCG